MTDWIVTIEGFPYYVESASNPKLALDIAVEEAISSGKVTDYPDCDPYGGWLGVVIEPAP